MIHLGLLQNFLLYEQHSDTYVPPWCVTKLPVVRATWWYIWSTLVCYKTFCCTSNIVIHLFHLGVLQNFLLYEQHSDTYDPPWCVTKTFCCTSATWWYIWSTLVCYKTFVVRATLWYICPPWCVTKHYVCTSNIVIHMFHLGSSNILQNVLLYEQHSDTYVPPWCVTKRFVVRAT